MSRKLTFLLAVALCVPALPIPQASAAPGRGRPSAVAGEVVVTFRSEIPSTRRSAVLGRAGASLKRQGTSKVSLVATGKTDVAAAIESLEAQPEVLYAEPNYLYSVSAVTPDDPSYSQQWALGTSSAGIAAPATWARTTGSSGVTVAVVDSGVQLDHPDLAPNVWQNTGEVAGNGIDDDGNGYTDDRLGWDWVTDDSDPTDQHGHGTHVAGIAGARGNDAIGVAGTSWSSKIMALRVLDENGVGSSFDIAQAFRYAGRSGVKVVNASLGGDGYSRSVADAVAAAPGTLFVVASGNGGSDGVGDDNDVNSSFPCNLTLANVICVAASNQLGQLSPFSNYGAQNVDLAAPGSNILSTLPTNRWGYASGTSMATPFVAGAAALLWAAAPSASVADVRTSLLQGVESDPTLIGKVASNGRLDAASALELLVPSPNGTTSEPVSSPSPTPSPTPTSEPASSPSPTPTEDPLLPEDPLPIEDPLEPTPEESPTPTAEPSPEPTAEPTPTQEPLPVPTVDPLPDEPVDITARLSFDKTAHRLFARGWIEPAADGPVKVVLKRRSGGRWRVIAKKFTELEASGATRSVFEQKFRRPSSGRCRLVAVIDAHDQITRVKRSFRC